MTGPISFDSKISETTERIVKINFDESGDKLWIHREKGPEIWSISSNKKIKSEHFSLTSPYAIPSSDNSRVVCFNNSTIRVYNFKEDNELHKIQIDNGSNITSAALSTDGKYLLVGSVDALIRVWDISEEKDFISRHLNSSR